MNDKVNKSIIKPYIMYDILHLPTINIPHLDY